MMFRLFPIRRRAVVVVYNSSSPPTTTTISIRGGGGGVESARRCCSSSSSCRLYYYSQSRPPPPPQQQQQQQQQHSNDIICVSSSSSSIVPTTRSLFKRAKAKRRGRRTIGSSGHYHPKQQSTIRSFATTGSTSTSSSPYVTHISPTTSLLRAADRDQEIYLLGTAHISEASANEVIQLVHQIKPSTIFLELDPPRAARLRHSQATDGKQEEELFLRGFQQLALGGGGGGAGGMPFGEEMLKSFFRGFYALLKRYGYIPGIEMIAAMKEAERIDARLVYGDRDINDTFRELSAAWNPALLMKAATMQPPPELQQIMEQAFFSSASSSGGNGSSGGLEGLGESLEAIKTREYARLMTTWMNDAIPPITEVMLHRRDKAMVQNLVKDCCSRQDEEGKSVLAVVGLAHMDGIEREWTKLQQPSKPQPK